VKKKKKKVKKQRIKVKNQRKKVRKQRRKVRKRRKKVKKQRKMMKRKVKRRLMMIRKKRAKQRKVTALNFKEKFPPHLLILIFIKTIFASFFDFKILQHKFKNTKTSLIIYLKLICNFNLAFKH